MDKSPSSSVSTPANSAANAKPRALSANTGTKPLTPLMETLDRFLAHAQTHGCTQEALKGLEKLKARERYAVADLF